jgi:hypothetical protein
MFWLRQSLSSTIASIWSSSSQANSEGWNQSARAKIRQRGQVVCDDRWGKLHVAHGLFGIMVLFLLVAGAPSWCHRIASFVTAAARRRTGSGDSAEPHPFGRVDGIGNKVLTVPAMNSAHCWARNGPRIDFLGWGGISSTLDGWRCLCRQNGYKPGAVLPDGSPQLVSE